MLLKVTAVNVGLSVNHVSAFWCLRVAAPWQVGELLTLRPRLYSSKL